MTKCLGVELHEGPRRSWNAGVPATLSPKATQPDGPQPWERDDE